VSSPIDPESPEARAGHDNLIAYSAVSAHWSGSGASAERDGVVLFAGGSPIPLIGNGAFRTSDNVDPADVIAQSEEFFAARGRGYTLKARDTGQDDDLVAAGTAAGLELFGEPIPQMLCRRPLADIAAPDGVELRAVADQAGVAIFAAVNAAAYGTYGLPAEVFEQLFDAPEVMMADPGTQVVVAWRGDEPLATALVYLDGAAGGSFSGGIQWVGTLPEARHMSLGALVTVWTTNAAFDAGASSVSLQASPMGAPLYAKLGYETIFFYRELVRWSTTGAPSAAER
jgi:hypothetical protein